MQRSTTDRASTGYVAIHPLDPEDAVITAAMRAMVSSAKGARPGIEARAQFDALMESVQPRDDVTFEADTVGGVPGLWVHPADWRRRPDTSNGFAPSRSILRHGSHPHSRRGRRSPVGRLGPIC